MWCIGRLTPLPPINIERERNATRANIRKASFATRDITSFVAKFVVASGDTHSETGAEEPSETVVISTTRESRIAKVVSQEPEYISDRYVKGSLRYQIGHSQSVCLDTIDAEDGEEGDPYDEADSRSVPLEPDREEASTSAVSESLWSSETFLRVALKRRLNYKKVIFDFSKENPSIDVDKPSTNVDDLRYRKSLSEEEELALQLALQHKRQIATEILVSSLMADELSATYSKDVVSYSGPFIDRIVTEAVALKKYQASKELSFNSRARFFISKCRVVALVKWLKHNKLTTPQVGNLLSIAGDHMDRIRPRVEWLKSIYVRGRDTGLVFKKEPRILERSLENLHKNVEMLNLAGVKHKWVGLVICRSPGVLTLSTGELHERISIFKDLGLSTEEFGVTVFNFPAIVGRLSLEEMRAKVAYLRQLGVDDANLVKVLTTTPELLGCSIEESWDKLLRYFYFLQIERSGIRRILGVKPSVFCLDLETNIAPKVKFLRAIGVHEDAIGQLIVDFPAVLTFSLDKKIRPVVRFLLEEAGVTEEKVGKVISMCPELIRCSLPEKLQILVKYFRSRQISAEQLGQMIADFPALLMYSLPVVDPKFQYLTRVMKTPLTDVVNFPRYFSYSLQLRIIPRHLLLKKNGLTFSLKYMLACSDEKFNTRVVEQLDIEKVGHECLVSAGQVSTVPDEQMEGILLTD